MRFFFKIILVFLIFSLAGLLAYQWGEHNTIIMCAHSNNENIFDCPYSINGGPYAKYMLANETAVAGRPELIKDPKVVKMSEPFNLTKFEKGLYKLSTDKGWSERKFDVDADGQKERIISANTAMNHTPNMALIVKNGRVIFKAEGANVWIVKNYMGRGFTLQRTVDWNTGESETIRYLPKNGGFISVWRQKSCWVHFQ